MMPVHVCDACDQVIRLVEVPATCHTAFRRDPALALAAVSDLWTVELFPYSTSVRPGARRNGGTPS